MRTTAFIAALTLSLAACAQESAPVTCEKILSPDGSVEVACYLRPEGPTWSLARKGKTLVPESPLGLVLTTRSGAAGKDAIRLVENLRLVDVARSEADVCWTNRFARRQEMRESHCEMRLTFERCAAPHWRMGLVFRATEAGVAFRYFIPAQDGLPGFQLMEEATEWRFDGNPTCWATLYDDHVNSQERTYDEMPLARIPAKKLVGMPLVVRTQGQMLALTEACLDNWAGFFFRRTGDDRLHAELSPLPPSPASTEKVAVIRRTPAESPWRVTLCADNELALLKTGDFILNLNPPPDPTIDFSWVRPGVTSWDWWVDSNNSQSTEGTLRLVDFAAEMGWPYHTIDGGWYGFSRRPNHGPDVELRPRDGFDLARIISHARAKGVGIWVWIHWQLIEDTGIEETFARLERWGVKGVKTDFLNRQDQWMVNWVARVARAAARHHVMINFHGSFKPTGTERTWPNNLTREGILGGESSKWGRFDSRHTATLPFTRFLIGPGDYTPGGFANVHAKDFVPQMKRGHRYADETDTRPIWAEEVGTRAHALALTIAFDSPLMTLCDWPDRYRNAPGSAVLRALPTVWKETIPLAGQIASHYAVARETTEGRFYLAAFSVQPRALDLPLDFLKSGVWQMRLWADDPARTPADARALAEQTRLVRPGERLQLDLLAEGGAVAIFDAQR